LFVLANLEHGLGDWRARGAIPSILLNTSRDVARVMFETHMSKKFIDDFE
jgi:anti-anti-sigma regulatory factor